MNGGNAPRRHGSTEKTTAKSCPPRHSSKENSLAENRQSRGISTGYPSPPPLCLGVSVVNLTDPNRRCSAPPTLRGGGEAEKSASLHFQAAPEYPVQVLPFAGLFQLGMRGIKDRFRKHSLHNRLRCRCDFLPTTRTQRLASSLLPCMADAPDDLPVVRAGRGEVEWIPLAAG